MPRELIMAIWTMETDNGTGDMGKLPVVRTLSTLAWDCRRTDLFQGELIAALKIVQRGDLPLGDLVGAFAGEIGQTSSCRRPTSNTASTTTVTTASTCAIGAGHARLDGQPSAHNGWKPGQPYHEGTPNFEAMHEKSFRDLSQDAGAVRPATRRPRVIVGFTVTFTYFCPCFCY